MKSLANCHKRYEALALALVIGFSGSALPTSSAALPALPVQSGCFSCEPGDGGRLFSIPGRTIKVKILPSVSDATNLIFLKFGDITTFIGTDNETGKTICLGPFSLPFTPPAAELVFQIRVTGEPVSEGPYRTGPASGNPDGQTHAKVDCRPDGKAIISFEDQEGPGPPPGSDRDFNDAVIEVSCCDHKCDLFSFRSPQHFLDHLNQLPRTAVMIGGVNFNNPVSNPEVIGLALQGGSLFGGVPTGNPLQQLNREFVAAQLSLALAGGPGSPVGSNALWSNLGCRSLFDGLLPTRLSNGVVLNGDSMLKDLFMQTQLAIKQNRTADYSVLTALFQDLNCGDGPFGSCPTDVAFPDLLPLLTKAAYCDRNAAGTQLTVTVFNAASVPAGCSVVTVEFFATPPVVMEKEVMTVPAFGLVPVIFNIPSGCFSSDCGFRITVNSRNCTGKSKVIESKRSNNTVSGNCVG